MHTQSSNGRPTAPRFRAASRKRRRQAGNLMLLFSLMMPTLLIPMIGLAIDATVLMSVKAKLQAGVDGAAIAAAEALNSGQTFAAQQAAAQKAADQFLRANLLASASKGGGGYWGAFNLQDGAGQCKSAAGAAQDCIVAAQDNTNKRTTINVGGNVQVPLIFMQIFGFSASTVSASGQAARRDVVLVMVIDRSSSMDNTINGVKVLTTLQAAATNFVNSFQPGRDHLGLVAFGGSALVAYPTSDWGIDPVSGTLSGPDVNFNTPAGGANTMPVLINDIAIGSNTGTAEGLVLAYKELQAANLPGALNVIVLFTDGQPNGLTANFNGKTASKKVGSSSIAAGSPCSYKNDTSPNPSMIGWMAQGGGYVAGDNATSGIYTLAQTDTTSYGSVAAWLSGGIEPVIPPGPPWQTAGGKYGSTLTPNGGQNGVGPGQGCNFEAPDPGNEEKQSNGTSTTANSLSVLKGNLYKDLSGIPAYDYYGNSTTGSNASPFTYIDYQQSNIWTGTDKCNNGKRVGSGGVVGGPLILTGAYNGFAIAGDACQFGLASWNAADQAAATIRADASGLSPVIYAMGFEGNGGDDPVFMQRLANLKGLSTVYNATEPQGMYLPIAAPPDIAPAFQTVLAEILRLAL